MTEPTFDGCTGFWWAEKLTPPIVECCNVHDAGGSDDELKACLIEKVEGYGLNLPRISDEPVEVNALVALVVIGGAVLLMKLFRPAYEWFLTTRLFGWLERKGLWPHR